MRHVLTPSVALMALLCPSMARVAEASPALRLQVNQHGDFIQIGNTLGLECAAGTPAPVVGTIASGACNQSVANVNDSSPDVYWAADDPTDGLALASAATTAAEARSTAVLTLPPGATVTQAFLYWGAEGTLAMPDTAVTVDRPGINGFSQGVTALQSFSAGTNVYQSVADVTALVQQRGSGAYRLSGIDVAPFVGVTDDGAFGGWSMVVFYADPSEPLRNLAIFDGLDAVSNGNNQVATLSGFMVPNAGFDGKLGVIAYEGDNQIAGDQLFFDGGAPLTDAQNPAGNFFNGTRSRLGAAVSVAGDLPQLTGGPQSMSGIDLDVVDITGKLTAGDTTATVRATTSGDVYYLGAFITSISTFRPDFTTSTKTAVDENGGGVLPGDVVDYQITVTNTGNDAAVGTILTDVLPVGVTLVPGSITIASGPNAGAKTDMIGDDQGELDPVSRTLTVRLGLGANATQGGTLGLGESSSVAFKVTIDAGALGGISNQAMITAGGLLGAPPEATPTDGNGAAPGNPPTTFVVDQCEQSTDCSPPSSVCSTSVSPHVCVGCVTDSDCGGPESGRVCDAATTACVDGCRGTSGNGCAPGFHCSSPDATIGRCISDAATASSSQSGTGGASGATTSSGSAAGGGGSGAAGGGSASATTTGAGTGGAASDGLYAEGAGASCAASPTGDRSGPTAWVVALAVALASRRRRPR